MLVLLGCNHRSAPIDLREKLAFATEEVPASLGRLRAKHDVDEALILATCNRVELLVRTDGKPGTALDALKQFLCEERGVAREELDRHVYHFLALDAVRHLFQVATGLDSMILGEPQILGQVKQAYRVASSSGATGTVLDHLLQQCLQTAKRVRTQTGISRNAVSVAFAAVNLARQIFGDLRERSVLLVGAGKMSELVAKHLVSHGVRQVRVTSRTYNRALKSAGRCGGEALHWGDGLARLGEVDIVVSCTGSPKIVLDKEQVSDAAHARRGEPLFIIDIAVPRDVDPEVNRLDNVYLYDIDGLQGVVDANLKERRQAAARAQREIEVAVGMFDRWRQSLEITPTIVSLREKMKSVARAEIERFRPQLGPLSTEQARAIDRLAHGMIQKILHRPIVHLKGSVDRGDVDGCTSSYRKIFGLDEPDPARDGEGKRPAGGPSRLLRGGRED